MKNVLFMHSAGVQGEHSGSNPLIAYLKSSAEDVKWYTPKLPRDEGQNYQSWVRVLEETLQDIPVQEELIIIGHSFGGSVVMKYLTENEDPHHITKVILIGSPFWGCDAAFDNPENALLDGADTRISPHIKLYDIQSTDDDRVDIKHQSCWKDVFKEMSLITKHAGKHEFHEGIPELVTLLNE